MPQEQTCVPDEAPRKLTRAEKKAQKRERTRQKRLNANKNPRLFPPNKKGKHYMPFMIFLKILLTPIHFLIYPYRLHGHTKAEKGACLFVGNHYSMFDVFYPLQTTWEGIHYICKQSVLEAPILWKWGVHIGAIGVARDGTDARAVMDALRVLKAQEKICMFPEGTRNKREDDEFLPFHGGAALFAIRTKSPVILFVSDRKPRPFRLTHVVFGEPIELTQYYDRKLSPEDYAEADEYLRQKMYELRENFRASRKKKGKQ